MYHIALMICLGFFQFGYVQVAVAADRGMLDDQAHQPVKSDNDDRTNRQAEDELPCTACEPDDRSRSWKDRGFSISGGPHGTGGGPDETPFRSDSLTNDESGRGGIDVDQ